MQGNRILRFSLAITAALSLGFIMPAFASCTSVSSGLESETHFAEKMAANGTTCFTLSVGNDTTYFNKSVYATGSYLLQVLDNGILIYNGVVTNSTPQNMQQLNTVSNGNLTLNITPIGSGMPYTTTVTRGRKGGYTLIGLSLSDATGDEIDMASGPSSPPPPPPGNNGECYPPANPALCY